MTREEAIKILHPATSREALLPYAYDQPRRLAVITEAMRMGAEALREVPKFEPGKLVWVVERDEEGNAYGPAGYVFLAQVAHAAIVTPQINGVKDLSCNVDWHIRETCFSQATDGLSVFPIKDCYETNDAAKAAKTAEEEAST